MTAGGYSFGDDRGRESERLDAVEQVFDAPSRAALSEAGVRSGWRCWEVGAGRGSIANWLAGEVGPEGHVLATDLDDRWFRADRPTNLAFTAHDLTRDSLPGEEFDLVHARFVLEHLADPQAALARLARALRPGGVLVLEDSAGLGFDVDPATHVFARLAPAWHRAGASVGWNALYGQALPRDLRAGGMADVRGFEYRRVAPGGEAWRHVASGLGRLTPHLREQEVAESCLAHAIEVLGDPANLITGPPLMIAFGRRPAGSRPAGSRPAAVPG
jgi:SAM-dependent methyltransferase